MYHHITFIFEFTLHVCIRLAHSLEHSNFFNFFEGLQSLTSLRLAEHRTTAEEDGLEDG